MGGRPTREDDLGSGTIRCQILVSLFDKGDVCGGPGAVLLRVCYVHVETAKLRRACLDPKSRDLKGVASPSLVLHTDTTDVNMDRARA